MCHASAAIKLMHIDIAVGQKLVRVTGQYLPECWHFLESDVTEAPKSIEAIERWSERYKISPIHHAFLSMSPQNE